MPKTLLKLVLTACLLAIAGSRAEFCPGAVPPAATADDGLPCIVPRPAKLTRAAGSFTLTPQTRIVAADRPAAEVGEYLAALARGPTGYALPVAIDPKDATAPGTIVLGASDAGAGPGPESYTLTVTPQQIAVRAPGPAGLFYGVQTLRQLLPPQIDGAKPVPGMRWTVPCLTVEDRPRFGWRGLLVDPARHFLPKKDLMRFIGLMAAHKLNVLQIHLTDHEGWRLPIRTYPKLTAHGPSYSRADIQEIVRFAAQRRVTLVPEIEMPGHAGAWLAACPEVHCAARGGAVEHELCPGNEQTYQVVEAVLGDVIEQFPGPWIHVGGDECNKSGWRNCPVCQARLKAERLRDLDQLESYFIKRVGKFIRGKGRTLIGWDEIMQGGLGEGAVVMSWRGVAPGQTAVRQGFDVIFSPTSHCYFDYPYTKISTEKTYGFDPAAALLPEQLRHVRGVQGNLWGERIADLARLEYMAYPRACALAEVAWSPQSERDWQEFQQRLSAHCRRLEAQGVNYCREGR